MALLVVALLGCGASPPVRDPVVGNAQPVKNTAFRGSRDMMVREVIALLAKGDVNALIGLADFQEADERSGGCKGANPEAEAEFAREYRKSHERIAVAAVRSRGQRLEIEQITPGRTRVVDPGDEDFQCRRKVAISHEEVTVTLRVEGVRAKAKFRIFAVEGRYYLSEVPRRISAEPDLWAKMNGYADAVCACKDIACVTAAGEAWAKQAAELAKESYDGPREITDDEKQLAEEITKKLANCTAKIVQPPTP